MNRETFDCESTIVKFFAHFPGMKDLENIERSFNLNPVRRHAIDGTSVEAWVQEMSASEDPCVLYYKAQGVADELYQSSEEDFSLVIMTSSQQEMLKKFGSDVICIDSTHGTNSYNFMLTTVLVLDELRQGFPCAFFVSNKTNTNALTMFFEIVKAKVGTVSCNIFMSDMDNALYNAWAVIMGNPTKRLFCSWHVNRAWDKNINSKIRDTAEQKEVYKMMKALQLETNIDSFNSFFNAILEKLGSQDKTKDFHQYMIDNYSHNVESWAYCHRMYSGINTNMHIERMHRTIKYIFLKKKCGRLDIAICALMRFVKSKVFDRILALTKGKVSSKLQAIRTNHKKSLESSDSIVQLEDGWIVQSHSTSFNVEKHEIENCDCKLICEPCKICIHQFACSCSESSIQWNMCYHIHLVALELEHNNHSVLPNQERPVPPGLETAEVDVLVSHVSHLNETLNNDTLEQKFKSIMTNVNSREKQKIVEKYLVAMAATLHAVDSQTPITSEVNVSHPQSMVPQRRLFSTKKISKPKNLKRLSKPTQEEANLIAIDLAISLLNK